MDAQAVMLGSRVAHLRELKTALEKANAENQRLRGENAALLAHFDLALAAAQDLRNLEAGGKFVIVDGWNRILGSQRTAHDRAELESQWKRHVEENPCDFVWIVYDGKDASSRQNGRLRVSYTGGEGPQRADRFICDFVRMAMWLGLSDRVTVDTDDKELRKSVEKLSGRR